MLVAHGRELARVILPEPNRKQVDDDVRRAVVSRVDDLLEPALMPANDGAAEASLYGVRDLPLLTMTHMRLQRVADGIINLHGRTDAAAVTRTRQVSTSVEPIRCRPVEPEAARRSAREPVAGRRMPGETTAYLEPACAGMTGRDWRAFARARRARPPGTSALIARHRVPQRCG